MRAAVAVAVAVLALVASCAVPTRRAIVGEQCERNSDCDAPLACRMGYCRVQCRSTDDCIAPAACVLDENRIGACQLPEERDCALATDCPFPLVCYERRCVNECAADRDCLPGALCVEGACVDVAEGACTYHVDCLATESCVNGRCRSQCLEDIDCANLYLCAAPDGDRTEGVCVAPGSSMLSDGGGGS